MSDTTQAFTIERQVVLQGPHYDENWEWFTPRATVLPDGRAMMLLCRITLNGSDVFLGNCNITSTDSGRTWSQPREVEAFNRQARDDGSVYTPADLAPEYHRASGSVLAFGSIVSYRNAEATKPIVSNEYPHTPVYAVYDPDHDTWGSWAPLGPLDEEHFYWTCPGAGQRVELPDGDILQPVYAMSREDVGENMWTSCFFSTVLRCRFDGETMTVVEQGNEMTVPEVRGLCEPSLVEHAGRFLLTLRNDQRGYVATSEDGLHFEKPRPWTFDDGSELGSYNTQQHWVSVGGTLMLAYTRRGANNDHVVRHRAPLFLAEVDPQRLVVLRETEQIIMPDMGGAFGNGWVTHVSDNEAWVLDAEAMLADAENVMDYSLTQARGADNRVYLVRVKWNDA